jgi:hypothetical protein
MMIVMKKMAVIKIQSIKNFRWNIISQFQLKLYPNNNLVKLPHHSLPFVVCRWRRGECEYEH